MTICGSPDILEHLDQTDLTGPAQLALAAALATHHDPAMMAALCNLGRDFAIGRSDYRACAVFQIVHAVAHAKMGNHKKASDDLATATTMLSRQAKLSDQMNEGIGRLLWALILSNTSRQYRKPDKVKATALALATEAVGLFDSAARRYAERGDLERWAAAKELAEWANEQINAAVPFRVIEQV